MCQNLQEMEIICFRDLICGAEWWVVQYNAPIFRFVHKIAKSDY